TVLFNVAFDPYQALMPDITPPVQRGRVMASWTLIGVVGQASILMIPMDLTVKFYVVALVMLVTTLLTCKFVREPVLPPHSDGKVHRSFKQEFAIANRGLRALEQARRGLMVYGLYGIGVGAIMPFLTLFVKHITKCTDGQAQQMFMILMISTAVAVLPFGWIADKIGSRRVLIIGIVLIATASILGIFVVTLSQIALVMALAGIGNAAQSAAAYPLMTQLIPRDEVGLYTGLQTVALSIAQPITVVVVGQMMNSGNFRSIFIVCAFSMFIGLAVLLSINMNVAAEEVKARQLELDGASA
ncbi:MAG: MFS transporter, partial [Chthonomonadales bacterium]